jgi:hypothetical protein
VRSWGSCKHTSRRDSGSVATLCKGTDTPMMDWVLELYLKDTGELHKVGFPTEEECKKAIPQCEALMNGYEGKCVKIKRQ